MKVALSVIIDVQDDKVEEKEVSPHGILGPVVTSLIITLPRFPKIIRSKIKSSVRHWSLNVHHS